jgi:uncharacterized membrane protein
MKSWINTIKSRIRNDRIYRNIMSGAMWIVFIASLFVTKWPQLTWLMGIGVIVIVVVVYIPFWIAVISDSDKTDFYDDGGTKG